MELSPHVKQELVHLGPLAVALVLVLVLLALPLHVVFVVMVPTVLDLDLGGRVVASEYLAR